MKKRCAKQSDGALAVRLASITLAAASICFAQEGRKVLRNPAPVYPVLAKRLNLSGVVKIKAIVGADGQLKQVEVIGGDPVLVESALEAVKEWKYAPAKNDTPVELDFKFHP
jgi:TonB family protein